MTVIELMLELIKMNPLDQVFIREDHMMIVPTEVIEEHENGMYVAMDMENALMLCFHDSDEE
jgi:hypothetical protein